LSFDTIRENIETYLKTNWATTPIQFPNTKFKTPDTFIRLQTIIGDTNQISLGTSQDHRTEMVIAISIFVKTETGLGLATQYADTLTTLFINKKIGVVNTRSPSIAPIAEAEGYVGIVMNVSAWADKVYTA